MNTLHFTPRTPHSTLYILHTALRTPHFHSELHTWHSTLYTTLCTLHSILRSLHSTLHTSHSTHHTPHLILYTLLFTLHTQHATLYSLHSPHYTFHSTLYTSHFPPHTPHFTLHTKIPTSRSTRYIPHSALHFLHAPQWALHCLKCTGTVTGENWQTKSRLFKNLFHKCVLHDCIRVASLALWFSIGSPPTWQRAHRAARARLGGGAWACISAIQSWGFSWANANKYLLQLPPWGYQIFWDLLDKTPVGQTSFVDQ